MKKPTREETFSLVSCNQPFVMISNASPKRNYDTWYFLHLFFSSSLCSACQSLIFSSSVWFMCGCVRAHTPSTHLRVCICVLRACLLWCQHDLGSVWVSNGRGLGLGLRMNLILNLCFWWEIRWDMYMNKGRRWVLRAAWTTANNLVIGCMRLLKFCGNKVFFKRAF